MTDEQRRKLSMGLASVGEMRLEAGKGNAYAADSEITGIGSKDVKEQSVEKTPKVDPTLSGINDIAQSFDTGDSEAGGAGKGALNGFTAGMTTGNPVVGIAGGVIGGIAGGLSSKSKRKARERKADADMYIAKGKIQQRQGETQSGILAGLANNLSNTLV